MTSKKIAETRCRLWAFLRQPPDFAVFSGNHKNFATEVFFALAGSGVAP
jgi:hypothetical protein